MVIKINTHKINIFA